MEQEEVGWGLEACTEVEQLDMVLVVCMVAELAEVTVPVELVVMLVHAGSPVEKNAQLVESVAVGEDPDQVLCHTLGLAREGSYRRRHTSTSEQVVISPTSDRDGISLASSRVVA